MIISLVQKKFAETITIEIVGISMITKYGYIADEHFKKYIDSIVGKIYAILPMKEEGVPTVDEYVQSLNRELVENINVFKQSEHVLSVVCLLNNIIDEEDHSIYRKEVLHCCNIMAKVGE